MTPPLAKRVQAMKASATVAISQRATELKAQGVDVLSFSVGEPDFETPLHIRKAAQAALEKGCSHYTLVRGTVALREAIALDSARRRNHRHSADEVVVSVGAKHTLYNLAMALYEPGDEVIVPAPYWVSYPAQVELAEGIPVIAETTEASGFKLTPDGLRAVTSKKTKALLLCSPSNPTGSAYSAEELRALAKVIVEGNYWVIVDEIYGRLVYGGFQQKSILEIAPELRDRVIIVDGVSKTFAMTGWRIGWMLGPAAVAKACDKFQGQATTNPTAIAQVATIAALNGPQEPIEEMRAAFEERRKLIVDGLNAIDGITCTLPDGAFYAFPNVKGLFGRAHGDHRMTDDMAVARYFLDEARCAVVPGAEFGAPGYLRISYAASNDQIREGLRRMREAVAKLG